MATTINALRTAQRTFSLKEWTKAKSESINLWLDTKSEFKSFSENIWQFQNFFLSLQLFKNSCNQLRGATVFAQPFGRAFLLPKASLYDGCLLVNFHALRSVALFLNNGESSRHPYQDGCKFKNSAIMKTLSIQRTAQRTFSLKEWTKAKSESINLWLDTKSEFKSFSENIWKIQNFFLSLPCQNNSCGTSAASSRWQFLYLCNSENNMAAPRRVCGNAPGSFARMALTTRSAASLCQKILVMATTINALRTAQRSFSVREWMNEKSKSLNLWLNGRSEFYTRICEFPVTRLLAIRVNTVSLCIILTAASIEQQPAVSAVSALCAAGLAYCGRKSGKGGNA